MPALAELVYSPILKERFRVAIRSLDLQPTTLNLFGGAFTGPIPRVRRIIESVRWGA